MKTVLVTGATGFIGRHVIRELLKQGQRVIATSTNPVKASLFDWFNKVEYIPFDFRNFSGETDYYHFFRSPDILIHLAWEGLPNYKELFHLRENLPRHFAFLENMVLHGLRDVTVTGTCFEYGMREGCLHEELEPAPSNAYASAKNELRVLLTELHSKHPFLFKWVRLFYMYGEGQGPNSLLSQLQSALERGDEIFNMSPGDQLRDYLEITRVAEYIVRIAFQGKIDGIINCCSGEPVQVRELVAGYLKKNNKHIRLNLGYYPYSDLEPRNFWGDNTKLKTILKNG